MDYHTSTNKSVMLIDNFDSFTHNLANLFLCLQKPVDIFRSDLPLRDALAYIETNKPALLVFSPGPGHPREATLCLQLLEHAPPMLPIFGVCLGMQCIIEHFGGTVGSAHSIVHGKSSLITHTGGGLFRNMPNPLLVGRYHSLVGTQVPACLVADAMIDDLLMATHHNTRPIHGVQFHPESILTPKGSELIHNLLRECNNPCQF